VIAGDDDKHLEATQGVNPGRSKAEEAARAVGGKLLLPIFAPGEQAANPKGFTDFNDLATKSVLGQEGIVRQVRSVVEDVLERQQGCGVEETAARAKAGAAARGGEGRMIPTAASQVVPRCRLFVARQPLVVDGRFQKRRLSVPGRNRD
jgi:phage/plasmid primase-like uncharacterized protein